MKRPVAAVMLAVSLVIGLSTSAGAVPVPWKNCGQAGDILSVQKFDASVWPPQAGRSFSFVFSGTVGKDIKPGATQMVSVTPRIGAKIYIRMFPWKIPAEGIKAGPLTWGSTFTVPWGLTSGTIVVIHGEAHNPDGSRIGCMDLSIPIK